MDALEVIKNWVKKDSEVLDLGCGKGEILKILSEELNTISLGIEIDQENITLCIQSGLNVIQQNIDEGLSNFGDKSFDMVIMSQTIQVLKEPKKALLEVTRIGKECIVTIPNFGYWSTRVNLLVSGKMPVTGSLPNAWHDTPNIHLCTIKDFELLCIECGINIIEKRFFDNSGIENSLTRLLPNLLGSTAMYKISK
ncbi:methionine biosynthesis protein MetW [Gammaproteobacteria bacterium]|nr:methionine biosynthesis protein MetW [SAR86 cluster bacterium]MDA7554312.1 methionine biosynthesis protein MetW [Gammaproteobacteria bacterium]MDB3994640.1 methionine biosynthesis protein MetW [Gammaproteobacteria bacterium]MDC0546399.1 methionine biosynthesis protein MetW [Gammaproteobacteria bacterium]MDC1251570.1 methionine biosynthesis protein MetW [Gammaproteobacteria bacterium]